jgi:hypothetical protein
MNRIINLYSTTSLIVVPLTTFLGFTSNLINLSTSTTSTTTINNKNTINIFTSTIGYTTIGFITGITFPISFPLIAGYTLKQNLPKNDYKKKIDLKIACRDDDK